jgi:hypothetical protein
MEESILFYNSVFNLIDEKNIFINFSFIFFKNKLLSSCLFNKNIILFLMRVIFYKKSNVLTSVNSYNFNDGLYKMLTNFFFNFKFHTIQDLGINTNLFLLRLFNLSLRRFLNYRFYNCGKVLDHSTTAVKMSVLKDMKLKISARLLGFKLACLGRFTRRQRVQ